MMKIGKKAKDLYENSIIWDNSFIWAESSDMREESLEEVRKAGITVICIKINTHQSDFIGNLRGLAIERIKYKENNEYILADSRADILRAKKENKTAITFSLADSALLESLNTDIEIFSTLGVTHLNLSAQRNYYGDSWFEESNAGLSHAGKAFVKYINNKNIILDGSLASVRTTLDAMELSEKPFIFSHVNPYRICKNIRNINDEQIRACAATNGVIGITFFGGYLGDSKPTPQLVFENIDYICELVGPKYVGFGSNFTLNPQKFWNALMAIKKEGEIYEGTCFEHKEIPYVIQLMIEHGYSDDNIEDILGKNWLRIYEGIRE